MSAIPDVAGMTKAEAAVAYAEAGWPVGPLWWMEGDACACGQPDTSRCASEPKNRAKHPIAQPGIVPRGKDDFTTSISIVRGWWRRYPDANIGLAPPPGIFGLDIDDPPRWRAWRAEHGVELVDAPWQYTGSGGDRCQLIYSFTGEGWAFNRPIPGSGAETKGDGGGYLVVAPSVTRGEYRWQRHGEVPEAPASLLAVLPRAHEPRVGSGAAQGACERCVLPERIERDPGGHAWLLAHAGHLKAAHGIEGDAAAAILRTALPLMTPPYPPGSGEAAIAEVIEYDCANPDRIERGGHILVTNTAHRELRVTAASSIAPRPVRWAWHERLARGTLSLLGGREGIGKSIVEADLIAQVTRGTLPGCWSGTPRSVIVVAAEDSWSHTIVPRLMAAGADLERVFRVDVVTSDGLGVEISLPQDLERLESAIVELGVALVCLDPLISRIDGALDTHKDAEVRKALEPIAKLADRTETLILGLIHVNKGQGDPLTVLMASRAFAAVPRAVLFMLRDPDDEHQRLLGQPKNNLGRDDLPMLRLHIAGELVAETDEGAVWAGKAIWDGESESSLHDVVAAAQDPTARTAVDEASEWLADYLADDGAWKKDVTDHGRKAGHAESAIKRAATRLKVIREGRGFPRASWWSLPVGSPEPEPPVGSAAGESELTEPTEPTGQSEREAGPVGEPTGAQSAQLAQLVHTPRAGEPTGDLTDIAEGIFDGTWTNGHAETPLPMPPVHSPDDVVEYVA